jgi:hypothetical protein
MVTTKLLWFGVGFTLGGEYTRTRVIFIFDGAVVARGLALSILAPAPPRTADCKNDLRSI